MSKSNPEFRKIKSLNYLYEINEDGTIFRNVKSKKQSKIILDFHHSEKGYYATFVHIGGRRPGSYTKRVMIHSAVAECWLGDRPEGYEIDHIDRNSHNNHYSNLRYVTRSEQMKNRDHSNISKRGSLNLQIARENRMIPVRIRGEHIDLGFVSMSECCRWLSNRYGCSFEQIHNKFKQRRSHIYDYDIIYLNAETVHGGSKEQETVHVSDLTGDYKSAFNEGKQEEVELRVKHFNG